MNKRPAAPPVPLPALPGRRLRRVAMATLVLLSTGALPIPAPIPVPFALSAAWAGAVSDSSWGRTPQTFSGQFTLPESLGQRAGNNLFHSFSRFSIETGESATFTTSTRSLANVIARVSGNEASLLDGQLRLTAASGSAPNLYLINPNGISFGAGARINVPAAFHASTAQELRFADGSRLTAGTGPDSSSLTIAAPAAFGFLGGAAAAEIRLAPNARVSTFLDGRDFDLTAGSIAFSGASMHNETGTLRLVATGTEATAVPTDLRQAAASAGLGGTVTLAASFVSTAEGQLQVHAGTLELSAGAAINSVTSLFAPGAIDISVRDGLRLSNSLIYSHMATEAAAAGAPLRIRSGGSIDISGTSGGLQTTTETRSAAGDIQVSAQTLNMSGRTNIASYTIAPGGAGNVTVDVSGQLRIVDSGGIFSQAVAGSLTKDITKVGAGGLLRINAGALTLDGTGSEDGPPSIGSDSTYVASPAGNISVTVAGPLVLRNGGNISSTATANPAYLPFATQRAGSVQVKAQSIVIESEPEPQFFTGIFSDSQGSQKPGSLAWGPGGPAGRVDVEAREIRMLGSSVGISADTSGPGAGGTVTVKADKLLIDGRELGSPAISSTTLGQGAGGVVTVQVADSLVLRQGGLIQALAGDSGRGGSVNIEAREITAEGSGHGGLTTGVLGTSVSAGAAGDLTVRASERITLLNGAVISANANDKGPSGAIRVETRDLFIDGQGDTRTGIRSRASIESSGQVGRIDVLATGQVLLQNAPEALTIKNESRQPDLPALAPKSIVLQAAELQLQGAGLVASSSGAAPGNAIDVQASGAMFMDKGARILTSAQDGNGGPISITAGRYLRMRDSQVESSVLGPLNGNGGNIRVNTPVLVLDNGAVQANTEAAQASGGDVTIAVRALVPSGSVLRLGGAEPIPFEPGRPGLNVIQAAAPEGLSGNVQVAVPALDLAGSLRALEAQVLDVGIVGNDFCGIGSGSSLVRSGRGGLTPTIRDVARPGSR